MYSQDGFSIYTLQMVQRIGIFFQEIKFAFKVIVYCFLLFSLSPCTGPMELRHRSAYAISSRISKTVEDLFSDFA